MYDFFFSTGRRHTRCALVTGVQTCALPISGLVRTRRIGAELHPVLGDHARLHRLGAAEVETLLLLHVLVGEHVETATGELLAQRGLDPFAVAERSEERRVGKGGVSTCRSRWSPYH